MTPPSFPSPGEEAIPGMGETVHPNTLKGPAYPVTGPTTPAKYLFSDHSGSFLGVRREFNLHGSMATVEPSNRGPVGADHCGFYDVDLCLYQLHAVSTTHLAQELNKPSEGSGKDQN